MLAGDANGEGDVARYEHRTSVALGNTGGFFNFTFVGLISLILIILMLFHTKKHLLQI